MERVRICTRLFSGAVLINQLIKKQMREQSAAENVAIDSIRARTEALRTRCQVLGGTSNKFVEPTGYAEGEVHLITEHLLTCSC